MTDILPQNNEVKKSSIWIVIVIISLTLQVICFIMILMGYKYDKAIKRQFSKNLLIISMFMVCTTILLFLQVWNRSSRFVQFIAPGMSVSFSFFCVYACFDLSLHYETAQKERLLIA